MSQDKDSKSTGLFEEQDSVEDVTRSGGLEEMVLSQSHSDQQLLSADGHRTHTKEYSVLLVNETPAVPAALSFQEGQDSNGDRGSSYKDQIVCGHGPFTVDKIASKGSSSTSTASYPVPESSPGDLTDSPYVHQDISANSNLESLIEKIVNMKLSTAQYASKSELESLKIEHHQEVKSLRSEVEQYHAKLEHYKSELTKERERRICAEEDKKYLEKKVEIERERRISAEEHNKWFEEEVRWLEEERQKLLERLKNSTSCDANEPDLPEDGPLTLTFNMDQ